MKYPNSLIFGLLLSLGLSVSATSFADNASAAVSTSDLLKFYAEDIKVAVGAHIADQLDAEDNFHIRDGQTGELLQLRFIQVHDPVRQIDDSIYFACTDFHVVGKPKKIYDIDFWLRPVSTQLKVYDTKIHKEPRWSLIYGWYKQPRYTFVNDEISYLY